MITSLKRFLACFLIAAVLVGMTSFTSAEAALKTPENCRFEKWTNSSFTSCRIKWNSVPGASGYRVVLTYTDGSHYQQYSTTSTNYTFKGLADNHVYMAKVRAYSVDPVTGKQTLGNFSNVTFITPLPTELSMTVSNTGRLEAKFKWNAIYGSNGYNVFLSTDPLGYTDWEWNQSTAAKATANTATVKKYKGKNLKKYTNYYVRIVTRRKRNGVFCSVPVPSDYCNAGFQMMFIR